MNETPQQRGTAAKVKVVVLRAVCDPSLKKAFLNCLAIYGFSSQADAIKTLARDFVAGRIQYTGGVLQGQQENSQPDSTEGQGGPPAAHTEANIKIKATGQ